jgi:DNA-binding CsgD family transcriptional regulator
VASIPLLAYLWATSERLRERNLRNLLDFVAEVEAAALLDESALKTLLVANLGRLVASDGVMLTGFDPRLEQTVTTASDPRVPELRAREPALWASCLGHHPTVVAFDSTCGGAPLRFSDVLTLRAYRRLPIYEYFFRPCGVEHKLDVRLWPTGRHVDVGCWREKRDFDEQERELIGALRPYLTVILRRATGTAIASRLRDAFGLTAREAAVLALVVRGHRAPEIARELVIAEGTARKHIERVYRKLGVSTRTQVIARILRESAVSPGAAEAVREVLHRLDVQDASSLYALTPREVEVLTLAAAGDTNTQIAAKLGARPETIKKHLDHVYGKLDVTGRGQAAAHALGLGLVNGRPSRAARPRSHASRLAGP